MRIAWDWEEYSLSPHAPGLSFPLLLSSGLSVPPSALCFRTWLWSLLLVLHAASLPSETAPRLFQLRGAPAPELKPAGFGGLRIFWIRPASVRVWLSAETAPGRCGDVHLFPLLHFFCSISLSCLPKRKTLRVSSHTFLHPPQVLPSCSAGQHQLWVRQVPGVSSIEASRPAGDGSIPRETAL